MSAGSALTRSTARRAASCRNVSICLKTLQLRILVAGSLARTATEGAGLAMVVLSIDRTGSAAMAGVLLACATLPQLATGPLVGAALDRSRRPGLILAIAVATSAAAVGALAVDRSLGPVAVAAALVTSVTQPALTGGLSASFARLADRPSDAAGIASWDAVAYNVAGLGGPALVTVLTAVSGSDGCDRGAGGDDRRRPACRHRAVARPPAGARALPDGDAARRSRAARPPTRAAVRHRSRPRWPSSGSAA